ncbi:MAG TPA: hypothetical protein ENI62_10055 [Gammaproteobacteria bacterium]|nr:hypothetical protein [Gammaproteobacteria bacterium]
MSADKLLLSHVGSTAWLTLNRPELHNAFDDELIALLLNALNTLEHDDSIRVLIVRSNGRSFSAGADLNWMQRMTEHSEQENLQDARQLASLMHRLFYFPKPTIARVQGAAIGGGVGLVACCDIAIASQRAVFALSEVRLGLIPAVISPFVIQAIGPRWARRLFITAERITAQQAAEIQLIHEVCDEDELDNRAAELAELITQGGPRALLAAKQLVADVHQSKLDETLLEDTSQRIARLRVSTEGQQGLQAFLDHTKAPWTQ